MTHRSRPWYESLALAGVLLVSACGDVEERTVAYDARFGDATSMDLYLPHTEGLRPALLIAHGGAWRLFSKERYTIAARRFARAGYVAASVNYRLVPEGEFPNAAHDVACALAYLQNHAGELGIDPSRIVTIGYSAGAHLTALVAVANEHAMLAPTCDEGVPAKPAGVISAAGPMDMLGLADVSALHDFMGGSKTARQAAYVLASPITHVTPDDPPFLFIHGSADAFVPIEQAYDMRDELAEDGIDSQILVMRGSGHIINSSEDPGELGLATILDSPEGWIVVDDFLARTVGRP